MRNFWSRVASARDFQGCQSHCRPGGQCPLRVCRVAVLVQLSLPALLPVLESTVMSETFGSRVCEDLVCGAEGGGWRQPPPHASGCCCERFTFGSCVGFSQAVQLSPPPTTHPGPSC